VSSKFFQLKSYLTYWLDAVDEHSLHSPFLFDFYTNVLKKEFLDPKLDAIKSNKRKLEDDHRTINVTDFGSGSSKMKTSSRKISDITRITTTPEKYSRLYSRILRHYNCTNILELGTSVGINTIYLARAHELARVTTIEGCHEIALIARHLFEECEVRNIQLIEGRIDHVLPAFLDSVEKIDFAFIDANHRFEPTVAYLDLILKKIHTNSILVLDDIHYSREMERAWLALQVHEQVHTTVDLYRCGLVFFNPSLTKQNAVLQF
jgi:predicted O-methyltransferase YrrM